MRRVAAIDCGTNSVRLLVADVEHGALHDRVREMRIVRLGQDVDRTGRLAPEAIARTRAALAQYADVIRAEQVDRLRMVATSATRDASNREEFEAMVRDVLGTDPVVVSGQVEAALSFAGAASVLEHVEGPLLVADIGGGSTELVRGGDGPLRAVSLDIGSVRMTERHLPDDPPTREQVAAAVADVDSALSDAEGQMPLRQAARFVGVAGTITTIAAIALGLPRYDSDAVNGAVIDTAQVDAVTERLLTSSRDERAAIPTLHPGRADIIGGGAIILRTVMHRLDIREVVASEHDILDGIALDLAEHPDGTPGG